MNDETQSDLIVTQEDGVMWLTFNRPHKANALSLPLLEAFNEALRAASALDDVRAVVITGSGERNFSAGADLSKPAENPEEYMAKRRKEFASALLALCDFRKPAVSAVNGSACGAGMMIPMLCDATVASESARFSLPEINKGLPALPGVAIMKDRYGSALASDIVLSGRWMPAAEAHARGVVREVVSAAGLKAAAQKIATTLGAFDAKAFAADKELLNRTLRVNLAASIETSAQYHKH